MHTILDALMLRLQQRVENEFLLQDVIIPSNSVNSNPLDSNSDSDQTIDPK